MGQRRFISSNKCPTWWRMLLIERLCICVGTGGIRETSAAPSMNPKLCWKIKYINKKRVPPVAHCLGVSVTLGQTVDSLITLLYICWRGTLPTVYLTMSSNETQVVTFIPLNLVLFSLWSPGPAARTLAPPSPAQPCGGLYRRKPPLTQQGKEPSLQARKESHLCPGASRRGKHIEDWPAPCFSSSAAELAAVCWGFSAISSNGSVGRRNKKMHPGGWQAGSAELGLPPGDNSCTQRSHHHTSSKICAGTGQKITLLIYELIYMNNYILKRKSHLLIFICLYFKLIIFLEHNAIMWTWDGLGKQGYVWSYAVGTIFKNSFPMVVWSKHKGKENSSSST